MITFHPELQPSDGQCSKSSTQTPVRGEMECPNPGSLDSFHLSPDPVFCEHALISSGEGDFCHGKHWEDCVGAVSSSGAPKVASQDFLCHLRSAAVSILNCHSARSFRRASVNRVE